METIYKWYESVEYLDKMYEEKKDLPVAEDIVCTGIFQTWYILTKLSMSECYLLINPELEFYFDMWKRFVCIAIDKFFYSASACWLVGYTATQNNIFDNFFNKMGESFLRRGIKLSTKEQPFDLLSGRKRRDKNDVYLIDVNALFPSECVCDVFFREKLKELGIE